MYRQTYSLLVSPFEERVDKKDFIAIYNEMRDAYMSDKDSYNYSEFVMPLWHKHMLEIERYFLDDFSFFHFLNHPIIMRTMFMYTFKRWRNIQKSLILKSMTAVEAKRILREYTTPAGRF